MDIVSMLQPGKRLRLTPEALNSPPQAALPEDGYDAGFNLARYSSATSWSPGHALARPREPDASVGAVDATVSSSYV
jgi:hypothetical protein